MWEPMANSGQTILLVEDDIHILDEIAGYLRRRNFHVVTAPNFGSGQQALRDEGSYPHVLVTDVNLPDGNGLDLLDEVNRRTPPPPRPRVVVMTGHLDQQAANKARRCGADAVLLKPFALRALLDQIVGSAPVVPAN
jgi:DNA-binding response OmpR family regulator